MINNVTLIGRLCREPELKVTESKKSVLNFTLACNDSYRKDHTDFVDCVAWNKSAEYLNNYARKDFLIGVEGKISTRNYEGKNGKVYVTEVECFRVSILEKKDKPQEQLQEPKAQQAEYQEHQETFTENPYGEELNLPFY